MTDVADTIRTALYDNWALTGSLARANIDFNTGVPPSSRKYPSIEVTHLVATMDVRTLLNYRVDEVILVNIWYRPKSTASSELATAKANRRSMLDEVRRIIHGNQKTLTGIKFAWIAREDDRDELDVPPHVLRTELQVFCRYFHTTS